MSTRKKYTAHKKNKYTKKCRNNKRSIHKNKKSRRSKNFRGGMCFGNGVGANSNDPNFSIYNTRLTELFPYKPTN